MNPWCPRHVIYIVRYVYSSNFKICKHIFFLREMNLFRRLTNSFFGLTFGATDKCFISSASSTCQVIFCLFEGSTHPQLVQFLYHQWSRVLLQRCSVHQSEGETAACIFVKTPTTSSIQLNTTTIDVGFDTIMTVHTTHPTPPGTLSHLRRACRAV